MFLCGIWKRVLQPKDTSTIQADAPLNISEAHSKCMLYLFCLQRTSHTSAKVLLHEFITKDSFTNGLHNPDKNFVQEIILVHNVLFYQILMKYNFFIFIEKFAGPEEKQEMLEDATLN